MITEDYVSFETAKLLKEKGFDSECDYLYVNGNIVRAQGYRCNWNKGETIFTDYKNECSAPTLQMVMKWLREVHHLVIQIEFIDFLEHEEVWLYSIIERKTVKQLTGRDEDFTEHSYEEACESAIKYTLENLI